MTLSNVRLTALASGFGRRLAASDGIALRVFLRVCDVN